MRGKGAGAGGRRKGGADRVDKGAIEGGYNTLEDRADGRRAHVGLVGLGRLVSLDQIRSDSIRFDSTRYHALDYTEPN